MPVKEQPLIAKKIPIDSVKEYKGNARIGDVKAIRKSLRINGQYRPIVVWEQKQEILAGNHTWKAAVEEGWTEIWATFIKCDAQKARRINLVDNRSAELGGWDEKALVEQLGQMPSLEGTGYSDDDLKEKLLNLSPVESSEDGEEEDTPVPEDDYRSQLGVMVMCADQEQQENVYKSLRSIAAKDSAFKGTELKVVAI